MGYTVVQFRVDNGMPGPQAETWCAQVLEANGVRGAVESRDWTCEDRTPGRAAAFSTDCILSSKRAGMPASVALP